MRVGSLRIFASLEEVINIYQCLFVFVMIFLRIMIAMLVVGRVYSDCVWLDEDKQINAGDPSVDSSFGDAVVLDGPLMIVGAYFAASNGAAYVFYAAKVEESNYVQKAKFVGPGANSWFGEAVDISSTTLTAVVGCVDDDGVETGAAWVYQATSVSSGWSEAQQLKAGDGADWDRFGQGVAVYGDGLTYNTILVSSPGRLSYEGAVYVWEETSPGIFTETMTLTASDFTSGIWYYGASLDLDESNIVVGATYAGADNKGAVYIYDPETYAEDVVLAPGDLVTNNYFGHAVSIDGTNLAVGSDGKGSFGTYSVYVFSSAATGTFVEVAHLTHTLGHTADKFGYSVSIANNMLIVGAYNGDGDVAGTGIATVFRETTSTVWDEFKSLWAPDLLFNSDYGFEVSITAQGRNDGALSVTMAVGSRYHDPVTDNEGSVFISRYDCDGECDFHLCENSRACIPGVVQYTCDCGAVLSGQYCDECLCLNGANCTIIDTVTPAYCDCSTTGAIGSLCETMHDECESSPCVNNGTCIDLIFDYTCDCNGTGATGMQCETDIDDCISSPCLNDGECYDTGLNAFECICERGLTGHTCESDIDDCLSSPCLNNGKCTDEGLNEYLCSCKKNGYEGKNCDQDIDDCASSPCLNNAVCEDMGPKEFQCICDVGYTGMVCETDIDDCVTNACQNEAICVDGLGNYTCNCTMEGYEGEFCDIDIDDCASSPCEHGGTCFDMLLDFICECTDTGYEGNLCEIYLPCFDMECQNGGTCVDGLCYCPVGYSGESCELEAIVTATPIVFLLSFDGFANSNDTAEDFANELPVLLSRATSGTSPSDFSVRLIPVADDGAITYEVTFVNYQDMDTITVIAAVEDPSSPVADRIAGDLAVESQVQNEEDVEKKTQEDMTWLVILLVFLGVALIAGGGYAAKYFTDQRNASKLNLKTGTKLNLPA